MLHLPINNVLAEIKSTLQSHNRAVLQASPGAGKTTAVPIALLEEPWLQNKQIIILEPRRLAARNAASRMAFLTGESVGQTIGYQIRQDNCVSDNTRILVVTEGILTRKIQADPELSNTALIIFDEFHERSLHADLSLALCLQSQHILRPDLKILVMSATLNVSAVSEMLAQTEHTRQNAPVIQCEGRSFPVDIIYSDKSVNQSLNNPVNNRELIAKLANLIKNFIHNQNDNCLVFLPGVKEINQLTGIISQYLENTTENGITGNIILAPLHGSLNKQQQDIAISPPPEGTRKIVLATNIAETSLTIEGVNCVIDSGLERILQYDPSSAMNRLITKSISQDSADQRCGRAGRLAAGSCYRLWSAQQQQSLHKYSTAEILHSDLSALVLELANWGVQQVDELHWLDRPPASAVEQAKTLLRQLTAIDDHGRITPHGGNMLKLGAHPRLAHMMLSSVKLGQLYQACLIASLLTEKDIYLANAEKSFDLHERLASLEVFRSSKANRANHGVINHQQCQRIIKTADDFFRRVKHTVNNPAASKTDPDHAVDDYSGVLLAFAYPDRIAKQRRSSHADYLLSNGKGASIPPYLQHHLYEYLVIANLDAMQSTNRQGDARIYLAAEITLSQLVKYFSELIQITEDIHWNEAQQRVESKQITRIGNITLSEKVMTTENRQGLQQCLLQAIKTTGLNCLNWSTLAEKLKQRVQFINKTIQSDTALITQPADCNLPDFSDDALLNSLNDWLEPYLTDETSFRQCQKLDIYRMLLARLTWEQQQLIDNIAPEKITVPSGSSISVDYVNPLQPVLAVRLQEVFGLYETPSLFNGQVKLMMHLLSPARRPMQVTQDLNSFWQTTYHEVKKELRGKYKRHYWPDDPFTAQATSKTRKNMHR